MINTCPIELNVKFFVFGLINMLLRMKSACKITHKNSTKGQITTITTFNVGSALVIEHWGDPIVNGIISIYKTKG